MTFEETSIVELKRVFTPALKKEIVAFANTEGGIIYLGVEDDGNVIGLECPQEVAESVNNMIHDSITPDLSMFAEAHVERFDDVDLVVVNVHRGPQRPYCIAGKGLRPEGVYVRQGTSSQPLPFDGIRHMLRQMSGDSFESARSLVQDLTFDRASAVFKRRGLAFGDAQKRSLAVIGEDGQFTNVGYLLSDQCECGVKVARFAGSDKTVFQTRRDFSGSVLGLAEDVFDMLDLLINVRAVVGSKPERIESRDYPVEALREALMNAIVHREYGLRASISVNVFDDRCEVLSPGGLPDGSTPMTALAGVSIPRNPSLAAIFYRLQWIEAYGTGIMRIMGSYAGTGFDPEVEFFDGAVKVVLPNVNRARQVLQASTKQGADAEECVDALTQDQIAVLDCLAPTGLFSKKEVADAVGFSVTKTARLLKELAEKGYAEGIGATKARVYRRLPSSRAARR